MAVKPDVPWKLPIRYIAFAIAFILLALLLWRVRRVFEPLIIAAFIAYLIHPGVNYLIGSRHMARKSAVLLVYSVTLVVLIGVPAVITPLFFDEFQNVVTDTVHVIDQSISWLSQTYTILGLTISLTQLADRLSQLRVSFLTYISNQAFQLLGKTSLGALWLLVILVAVYFILARWPDIREGFIGFFPEAYQPELTELYKRLRLIWMSYLRGQLTLMIIVGVAFTIAWMIIGVPGALVLGVIAGLMTIIPDVGPFLAAALAVVVAALEGSNWFALPHLLVAAIVLAVYLVLISIKNFWLRPLIMGRSVHMPEALIFVSILLATVLWGILGALLVVPVLASLVIIGDYLRRRILGMPPFPPSEPFITTGSSDSGTGENVAPPPKPSRKKKV